jgi:hypothetical protein
VIFSHFGREVDRNSKALFASSGAHPLEPPSTLAAGHPVCPVPCGSPAAAPRRRTALRGFGWCWTGAAGWGRECLRGALERRPREGRLGRLGGKISNGRDFKLFRHEIHLHCTHVAPETTCDVVGLGDPVERCLAQTGRCNGRWDGGQLAMT